MAEKVARTTISLPKDILAGGKQRGKALRYKNFSAYVEFLIIRDTRDRVKHVMVREEGATYGAAPKKKKKSASGAIATRNRKVGENNRI